MMKSHDLRDVNVQADTRVRIELIGRENIVLVQLKFECEFESAE